MMELVVMAVAVATAVVAADADCGQLCFRSAFFISALGMLK
jgi:hypothetical protein